MADHVSELEDAYDAAHGRVAELEAEIDRLRQKGDEIVRLAREVMHGREHTGAEDTETTPADDAMIDHLINGETFTDSLPAGSLARFRAKLDAVRRERGEMAQALVDIHDLAEHYEDADPDEMRQHRG